MTDSVRKLALNDGRYAPEAFQFLYESLDTAVQLAGRGDREGTDRHVSGQELLLGLRAHAREVFGPLAAPVWRSWGVQEAMDWGHIVFLLVDAGLLNRQESDTIDDFRQGFDFDAYFVREYVPLLPQDWSPPDAGGAQEGHA
ncbi:MAG: hypothetical protein RIT40_2009 [Planctomycetota bacterium]